jgi:outer membrane protein OmpA-like peptidoglycan-associated protein
MHKIMVGLVTVGALALCGCSLVSPKSPASTDPTSQPPSASAPATSGPSASTSPPPTAPTAGTTPPTGADQLGPPVATRKSAESGQPLVLGLYPLVRDGAVSHLNFTLTSDAKEEDKVQIADLLSDNNSEAGDKGGWAADGLQVIDGKNSKIYLVASDGAPDSSSANTCSPVSRWSCRPPSPHHPPTSPRLMCAYPASVRSSVSRSPERRLGRRLTLATGIALLVTTTPAVAAPVDDGTVRPITAPVQSILAPVLDISFADADLKRTERTDTSPGKITVTLDSTVLFGKDSAKINSRADQRLAAIAAKLKKAGPGSVRITGYTDDLGSAAHGLTLSRQRAQAVGKVLRSDLSAGDFPFTIRGRGEQDPAVPNKDEASRKINRRVVIVYQRR